MTDIRADERVIAGSDGQTELLWRPSRWKEVPPEPVAVLSYEDHRYAIPYTLMHWITGWLAVGMHGTAAPCNACQNTRQAFDGIRDAMMRDAAIASAQAIREMKEG